MEMARGAATTNKETWFCLKILQKFPCESDDVEWPSALAESGIKKIYQVMSKQPYKTSFGTSSLAENKTNRSADSERKDMDCPSSAKLPAYS